MSIVLNLAHRNAIAGFTGGRFDGGSLVIRDSSNDVLAELDPLPTPAFGSPSGGSVEGSWSVPSVASGAPDNFVLANASGTDTRSGSAGAVGSGAVMAIADLEEGQIVEGRDVAVTYTITQPSGE